GPRRHSDRVAWARRPRGGTHDQRERTHRGRARCRRDLRQDGSGPGREKWTVMDLRHHRAVVVGAAGAIGSAICRAYPEAGGAFYAGQAFATRMLGADRPGSFVFLSSTAGKRGEAGASAYCASKFGLIGMMESFAAEVAAKGIRVNAICPGNVDSPMLRAIAR